MSLDVTILDDQDQVIRSVGLGVDEHWELVQLAAEARLPLLERMHDYYSDAQIAVEELPAFLEEMQVLAEREGVSDRLRLFLTELAHVTKCAIATRRSLTVIAD